MPRNATRILALAAISATAMLGLTACAPGTGNNSAPDNDQSSAKAVAQSFFQDLTHMDTAKLSAILEKPLSKSQQASMSASVDQWGGNAYPYTEFHVASVEPKYDGNGYKHKAYVNYTFKYNGKLTKSNISVHVDPTVDDKVWMVDSNTNIFALQPTSAYPIDATSNEITLNGKTSKATKATQTFPGLPYTQKITFRNNLVSPATIKSCGAYFGDDGACKGKKIAGGEVNEQKVGAIALAALRDKVASNKVATTAPTVNTGPDNAVIGSLINYDDTTIDAKGKAMYDTYAAAGNYYKFGSAPTVNDVLPQEEGITVSTTGGAYQAYDFDTNAKYEGCGGDYNLMGCSNPVYTYTYDSTWHNYTFDSWYIYLNKKGEVSGFQVPMHTEDDIVS